MCFDNCRHASPDGVCHPGLHEQLPCKLEDEDGEPLDLGHLTSRYDYDAFFNDRA